MRFDAVFYHFFSLLPCAAFVGGYRLTEVYFKEKMIPFPFEDFGAVTGAGCFFYALGFVVLFWTFYERWRGCL